MRALRLALPPWLLAALLLGVPLAALAQDVLPVPALTARVIDQTGTLDAAQRAALEERLAAFERSSGTQMVVLLVATTAPEDIAAYAQRVADSWKIGRREVGDGLLIVVAKDDRRIRIEVAKALEGAVPDLAARLIIDRQISPAFRAGNFAGGLDAGVDALMARIKGEALPEPAAAPRTADAPPWEELAMFFFIAVFVIGGILSRVLGRRLGAAVTSGGAGAAAWALGAGLGVALVAALLAFIMVGVFGTARLARQAARRAGGRIGGGVPGAFGGGWGGGGGGGWGGGGFGGGGGGFGSGGGGDFGGGGASGDW